MNIKNINYSNSSEEKENWFQIEEKSHLLLEVSLINIRPTSLSLMYTTHTHTHTHTIVNLTQEWEYRQ